MSDDAVRWMREAQACRDRAVMVAHFLEAGLSCPPDTLRALVEQAIAALRTEEEGR